MAVDGADGRLAAAADSTAHVFLDLEVHFAVCALFDVDGGQLAAELIANLRG